MTSVPTQFSDGNAIDPVRVLIVDDDPSLRGLIGDYLRAQSFQVLEASGGATMRAAINQHAVDVVVLDVMMPGEDGLKLARELAQTSPVAVIMVSALGSETDRIVGLEVGADDYLAKPVSPRELLARIRAVLRRRLAAPKASPGGLFLFQGWACDVNRRVLRDPGGVVVGLSQGEFALLRALLEHPQRVLTRDQLLDYTRGDESDAFDRAIDTQISRLRRKLAECSPCELIRTVRNEGYMFMPRVDRR